MSEIRFFDLLGVSSIQDAAELWPIDYLPLDPSAVGQMAAELEGALTFRNLRPSASDGSVGLSADVLVGALPPTEPIVFSALPKFGFFLLPTSGLPARLYARRGPTGAEWVIEALPIEIRFPDGLLVPFDPTAGDVTQGRFVSGQADTYEIGLRAAAPSSIKTHAKLRVSEAYDFVLEFATPVSIGPCRFSGVPCAAVHDLALILNPNPSSAMDHRTEALEWLRHKLDTSIKSGCIAVRTIDLFSPGSRLFDATQKANQDRPEPDVVEPVLEDLVLLASTPSPVPFPLHFTAGVRRSLGIEDDKDGIYNLGNKPVVVPLIKETAPGAGGGLYLIVRQALIRSFANATSLDDPQTAFLDVALSDDPNAQGFSATFEITDEWTLEAGFHFEPPKTVATLFNSAIKGSGARAGVSFKRLFKDDAGADFLDASLLVFDLVMVLGGAAESDTPVTVESKSGQPTTIVINGIGVKFGEFEPGNFWQPDKVDLKAAGFLRLSVDQFGFVSEPNGARYFSFSGTLPIFGTPTSEPKAGEEYPRSLGLQFYRLRWKIHGASDAPRFLFDGLGLFIQYKSFSLIGSGMLIDRTEGSIRYRESALAVELSVGLGESKNKNVFVIGGQFLYGRASGSVDFRYVLAGLKLSPIPLTAGVTGVNLRGLFAWHMQPHLGAADAGTAQPMRLFEWYKTNFAEGVEIPATRNITAAGWEPKENSWAFAGGLGLKFGGSNAVTIDGFFLYLHAPSMKSFLAALEVYLGSKKPIAYGVLEVEGDHWSTLIGLAIGIENAVGRKIPFFDDAMGLTGTFYATNQPATFAIGRLNDTSSWLALRIGGDLWVFKVRLFIGVCLELVDVPGGSHVIAFRAEFSGGTRKCAIGSIDFSLAMELIVGVWRSESKVSGFVQWLEGSIRINVLYVFRFGASFKVEWAFLGPDPAYRRVAAEVHIHTPWWMPDKTFRWNRTIDQPQPEDMGTVSCPLLEGGATGAVPGDPISLPISALSDDPQAVFSIIELQALPAPSITADAPAIPIDSVVSLHFKPAVDDKLIWGQNTPAGASLQESGEMSTSYELVEIGIRRRPLYGPNAGSWSTLLDPAESRTDGLLGNPPDPASVRSPVAMRWDNDFQREQALDPRHLLLNSELPYRFFHVNFANDENLLRTMPGWPCCPAWDPTAGEHVLNFERQEPGARASVQQLFTNSQSPWRWLIAPPFVHAPTSSGGRPFARLEVAGLAEGPIATLLFDQAAAKVSFEFEWKSMHLPRSLVISAFRGLKLIDELELPLHSNSPPTIALSDTNGISHVVVRLTGRPIADTAGVKGPIDVVSARYEGVDDKLGALIHGLRCGAFDPQTGGNGSRFAWLPNHEYEVRIATRVSVAHASAGALEVEVPQLMTFHTKGILGLNRAERIGEEIEPYVESQYPPKGMPLYRSEPAMLAFSERFDVIQRIDHLADPTDPLERKQQVDWELVGEIVTGYQQPLRLSSTGSDWIVAHRGTGTSPSHGGPKVRPTIAIVRHAASIDPLRLRFEAAAISSPTCSMDSPSERRSRVLSHPPIDPRMSNGEEQWPARSQVRMNLRLADSPYVERQMFEDADATAFSTSAAPWHVTDGILAPSVPGAVQLASFGEASWQHLQASVELASMGTRGGLALATSAGAALIVWVEANTLRIVSSVGAQETELASAPVLNAAPLTLSVTAFDDEIVARAGSSEVRTPRGEHRDGKLALAADGNTGFSSLRVDGLDAYRFEFQVSRFKDFADHVGSFGGTVTRLPAIGATSVTPAELQSAEAGFAEWVSGLGIPLRAEVERLEISSHESGVLVIESPEPLGRDVVIKVRMGGNEVLCEIVSDESGMRLLIVPSAALSGDIELEFKMSRDRYRSALDDGTSSVAATATVTIAF
jgi:hypothetical protein